MAISEASTAYRLSSACLNARVQSVSFASTPTIKSLPLGPCRSRTRTHTSVRHLPCYLTSDAIARVGQSERKRRTRISTRSASVVEATKFPIGDVSISTVVIWFSHRRVVLPRGLELTERCSHDCYSTIPMLPIRRTRRALRLHPLRRQSGNQRWVGATKDSNRSKQLGRWTSHSQIVWHARRAAREPRW